MPYYYPIKWMPKARRARTLAGLKRLRQQLDDEMPPKSRTHTLVLGTWNLRNFDDNRFMSGPRTDEDFFYIAEIISRFDVVAVQEICDDVRPLKKVMDILGERDFDFIITDVTEGASGNKERLGFVYDKSKVWFQGIAGELVLPENLQIVDGEKKLQFARTPFMCAFQSGWFKFFFSTVHIYFGSSSGKKYERRVAEINEVAKFLAKRAKKDDQNHILVGDFNIVKGGSKGYNALAANGFQVFQNKEGSNKDQTKFYDQISFRVRKNELRFAPTDRNKGVLQFFKSIYREEDFASYKPDLKKAVKLKMDKIEEEIEVVKGRLERSSSETQKEKYRKSIAKKKKTLADWKKHLTDDAKLKAYYLDDWRTFHGSDHLPLWVELEIDFSGAYLDKLAEPQAAG